MATETLKSLETRIRKHKEAMAGLTAERKALDRQITEANKQIQKLSTEIQKFKRRMEGIQVSEHAIVRYFERCMGFDIAALRREILPEEIEALVARLGNGAYPVDGHSIRIRDGVVATVIEKESKAKDG